jgi:hypothetical protein
LPFSAVSATPPNAVATFWNGQAIIQPEQGKSKVISFSTDQAAFSPTRFVLDRQLNYT